MTALAHPIDRLRNSVALPAILLVAGALLIGAQLDLPGLIPAPAANGPETVTLAPADFTYRAESQAA